MQESKKVLMVKHPTTGQPYAIFAKTIDQPGVGVAFGVAAVVKIIMVPGSRVPMPIEIHGREMEEVINACMDQIVAFAQKITSRWEKP